jgi:hypothetical protein
MDEVIVGEKTISLPFRIDPTGNVTVTSSYQKIWSDRVRSALATPFGSRVMRPTYGSAVYESEFDTTTAAIDNVKKEVENIFATEFTELILDEIVPEIDEINNIISISVNYILPNLESGKVTVNNLPTAN